MALPVLASSASTAVTATVSSIVVTKPTSLAVGDSMIATIGFGLAAGSRSFTTPSGWTLLQKADASQNGYAVFHIVATATETAASDFTFAITGGTASMTGGISRITGLASGSEIASSIIDSDLVTEDTSFAFTGTAAHVGQEIMALATFFGVDVSLAAAPTMSTYASTPTATYTETYERSSKDGASDGLLLAVASATYTGTTSFTAFSAEASEGIELQYGVLVLLQAPQSVTPDVAHMAVPPTVFGVSGTNSTTATIGHTSASPTVHSVNTSGFNPIWTNLDKGTTTWTNTDK